jgi:hypothetical protein
VKSALSAIAGIDRVDVLQSGIISTLNIRGKNSPETREQIASVISQRGWALREMRQEGASLEEFFVRITDPGSAAA